MPAKDKRIKGCPNEHCEAFRKIKYKASENFCSKCGASLVYICAKCGNKIEDFGPDYRICAHCEAEKADFKDAVVDKVKQAGGAVIGFVAPAIALGAKPEIKKALVNIGKKGAKIAIEAGKQALKL